MRNVFTLICLVWFMGTYGLSQDTVRIYLNDKYEVIENKEKAAFIREAYVRQNKIYHITDKYLDGQMIVEGEYSSLNPWIEDGYFKYYDEIGYLCAEGSYVHGNLNGKWVYHNYKGTDTVDYTTASKMMNNSFLKGMTLPKTIPASIELVNYVQNRVKFPARASDLKDKAIVEMNIVLTKNRHVIPDIPASPHKDLSVELCRVLMTVPDSILWRGLDTSIINNLNLKAAFIMPHPVDTAGAYVFVSEQALFQGGDINAFRDYIQKNLIIPEEVKPDSIHSRATVQFMVRYDGIVDKVKLLRSSGNKVLDDIIVNILKNSPPWKPAMNENIDVSQQFVIPVIIEML